MMRLPESLDRCPANPGDALVSAALDAGGADNVTVIGDWPRRKGCSKRQVGQRWSL